MIQSALFKVYNAFFCKRKFLCLAFLWFLGLCSGKYYAVQTGSTFLLLMRTAVESRPSIVGQLISVLLPLLLLVLSVYFLQPIAYYFLAFIQSLSLGYICCCIQRIFGSASWLVCLLFLFSSFVSVPFYCWFLIRHISGKQASYFRDSLVVLGAVLIACIADYFIISPFLTALF